MPLLIPPHSRHAPSHLEHSSPKYLNSSLLPCFRSLLKSHFLGEFLHDHPIYLTTLPLSSPFLAFLSGTYHHLTPCVFLPTCLPSLYRLSLPLRKCKLHESTDTCLFCSLPCLWYPEEYVAHSRLSIHICGMKELGNWNRALYQYRPFHASFISASPHILICHLPTHFIEFLIFHPWILLYAFLFFSSICISNK